MRRRAPRFAYALTHRLTGHVVAVRVLTAEEAGALNADLAQLPAVCLAWRDLTLGR